MARKLEVLELDRISQAEYSTAPKSGIVVVLDNVRSLNNIGSVFRTSDAYRVDAIYLCGISATPPHPEIRKTALGAEESVPWHYFAHTIDALKQLRQNGYTLYAIEQAEGSIDLNKITLPASKRIAIILGNEVKGVDTACINASDEVIELRQYGTKHSLNVSVTAGIVIYELFHRLYPEGL